MNNEQQTQQADDPSGDGWRWVEASELLRDDDMQKGSGGIWRATRHPGQHAIDDRTYRRRIQPQQPSDSEPETMEDLRRRLAEYEVLLAEVDRAGQQVNAELQQLREQVQTLTRELKDKSETYQLCLQNHYKAGQRSTIDRLQAWLKPVLELVADDPEDASLLAVAVLGSLPQIASRLIEE